MKRLIILLFYCGALFAEYPATLQHPVTLVYPGDEIVDPYLWLENDSYPEVKKWDKEQNTHTKKFLAKNSAIPVVEMRLNSLRESSSTSFQAGNTPRIITIEQEVCSIQEDENADKIEFLKLGKYTHIDKYEVSPDGRYFAYLLSKKGNEKPQIKVIDLNTLNHLDENLFGDFQLNLAWHPNSKGFFYTAYPKGETYHRQGVYHHKIGSKTDKLLLRETKEIAWYYSLNAKEENLEVQRSHYANKGFNVSECYHLPLIDLDGEPQLQWRLEPGQPMLIPYKIKKTTYYRTNDGAPNFRIVKKDLSEFIPETKNLLLDFCQVGNNFAATYLQDGRTLIKIFDSRGKFIHKAPLPDIGVASITPSDKPVTTLVFESMVQLPTTYEYDSLKNSLIFDHKPSIDFDSSNFEISSHFVTSPDGVKIPLFLAHKKGLVKNGNLPVLICGYGGFGISILPKYDQRFVPWIEAGGVVAIPCLRGGGEYGEKWHRTGMRKEKQNTFDDCIATAEWLIDNHYTNPKRLAIFGRSNGGLLVGSVVTQRPDLFKAAFCGVALLDMLRYDLFPIGAIWKGEYGNPQNPKDYPVLKEYSPYHYPLDKSVPNPAILFIAAKNDYRVHPMHMRKMAAKMQATYPEGNPILYLNDPNLGHITTDRFSATGLGFLMEQVNLKAVFPKKSSKTKKSTLHEAKKGAEYLKAQKIHHYNLNQILTPDLFDFNPSDI